MVIMGFPLKFMTGILLNQSFLAPVGYSCVHSNKNGIYYSRHGKNRQLMSLMINYKVYCKQHDFSSAMNVIDRKPIIN